MATSTNSCLVPCRERAAPSWRDLTKGTVKGMDEQRTGEESVWIRRLFRGWTQGHWWVVGQGHARIAGSWQRDEESASPLLRSAMRTPRSLVYSTALLAPTQGCVQLPTTVCVWVNHSPMITWAHCVCNTIAVNPSGIPSSLDFIWV